MVGGAPVREEGIPGPVLPGLRGGSRGRTPRGACCWTGAQSLRKQMNGDRGPGNTLEGGRAPQGESQDKQLVSGKEASWPRSAGGVGAAWTHYRLSRLECPRVPESTSQGWWGAKSVSGTGLWRSCRAYGRTQRPRGGETVACVPMGRAEGPRAGREAAGTWGKPRRAARGLAGGAGRRP